MLSNLHAPTKRRLMWIFAPLVFGATLLVYWPSLRGGVLWDDPAHLTIPKLQSWSGLWRILTNIGTTQEYYPVLHGAFWLEHRLWGDYLPAYHLLNIALHSGSACLLALILARLWSPVPGTGRQRTVPVGTEWFVAFFFALHPVAVESVAWITEQKNTLSVFLYFAAALAYLKFHNTRRPAAYLAAFTLFALALGAKTATFTLPPALMVLLWWRDGRIDWKRHVVPLLPWFALAVFAGLITVNVETHYVGAKGAAYALTFGERLLLAPRILWFYAGKLVWPEDLLFFYPRWNVPREAAGWWGYLVAAVVVTAALWRLRCRTRGPLAGWLLFLGAMFPVIGFFNVFAFLFSYVADHFQYMPCFTFVAAATGMIAAALARWSPVALRVGAVAAIAVLAAWGAESHRLSALYESNQTLFGHVVAHNPDSWMAHQILGSVYGKSGQPDAAAAQYREVIRINPDHPDAYQGLAYELAPKPGHRGEAIALYEKSIELRPHYVEAHYNLGVLLAEDPGRRADAIAHLKVTAGLQPSFVEAQTALGRLLAQDPATLAEAMEHLQVVLQYRPNDGTAHRDLADALARARRINEALPEYETALRLNPRDAVAHFHLADVLMAQRQADLAVTHYEAALQIDPDLAAAHAHLARALASLPARRNEALQHAIIAAEKAPRDLDARNLLGMLYAEQGQLDRARGEWEQALRIDPNFSDARRNLELLDQMQRQRAGR